MSKNIRKLPPSVITGKQIGENARMNGAKDVHDCPDGRTYIEGKNGKAVIIPSGPLKPHAAFHIGVLVKWLLVIMGLILAVSANTGGLSGLIK